MTDGTVFPKNGRIKPLLLFYQNISEIVPVCEFDLRILGAGK